MRVLRIEFSLTIVYVIYFELEICWIYYDIFHDIITIAYREANKKNLLLNY